LPRIADGAGDISYEELVGLVVTFTFPEQSTPENYDVSLTYFDVDEDTVTVASSDELVDAIEQFAGKKVLRITTEVKPKTKVDSPPAASTPTTPQGSRTDRGTSTQEPSPHPQIQHVLASFVGILASAVSGLQEGLAAPSTHPAQSAKTQPGTFAPATSESSSPEEVAPKATAPSTDDAKHEPSPETKPDAPKSTGQDSGEEEPTDEAAGEVKPEEEARLFIHGRHTCDSCLTTPIVGKRYHASNLPDYDLCSKCVKNYKGTEVKFEPVELGKFEATASFVLFCQWKLPV
jgi:hypothetical protein